MRGSSVIVEEFIDGILAADVGEEVAEVAEDGGAPNTPLSSNLGLTPLAAPL